MSGSTRAARRRLERPGVVSCLALAIAVIAAIGGYDIATAGSRIPRLESPTAGTITEALDPALHGPLTFGFQLCLSRSGPRATITGIGPSTSVGDGLHLLGVQARTFPLPASVTGPIGAVSGYPPAVTDRLMPAVGFSVSGVCPRVGVGSSYSELLVGLQRTESGGGWLGIDVDYTEQGHHRVARVPYDIVACGPAVDQLVGATCSRT